jgi:hypothetical protein
VEVEKHAVFSKRLEASEGIMQAAMHATLPASVADGGRFNSTRLQDAQTAKNVTKGMNPGKTSITNTEKDKARKQRTVLMRVNRLNRESPLATVIV